MNTNYAELNGRVWAALATANALILKILFGLLVVIILVIATRWLVRRAVQRYWKIRIGPAGDADERSRRLRFLSALQDTRHEGLTLEARRQLSLTPTGAFEDARAARAYDRYRQADPREQDSNAFLTSFVTAYWTNNTWFGYLVGGSYGGAVVGSTLAPKPYRNGSEAHGGTSVMRDTATSCSYVSDSVSEPSYCSSASDWNSSASDSSSSYSASSSCSE